ncbi:MAG: MFS transporter [Verrucomicrobiaceae bacterium]|nr:MAG: MFS transporter [Verrucomicrobiaceae bacterium]
MYICGRLAGRGRKRLLALAFMLLALRGFLYTVTDAVPFLLLFQVLDGITAGMFLLVAILVVHDVMGTSGLGSFAQGLLATALSLGSTMSHSAAGLIVDWAGFRTGFMFLTGIALVALLILWKALPETLRVEG